MEDTEQYCKGCMAEREIFARTQNEEMKSPRCLELICQAIEHNQHAQNCFHKIFTPWIRMWAQKFLGVEPETIIQETWIKIFSATSLLKIAKQELNGNQQFGRVMRFLKTTTKNKGIDEFRASSGRSKMERSLEEVENVQKVHYRDLSDALTSKLFRQELRMYIKEKYLLDLKTELVFHCRFVEDMPPRKIYQQYGHLFTDIQEITNILHDKLLKPMRKDPYFKHLQSLLKEE